MAKRVKESADAKPAVERDEGMTFGVRAAYVGAWLASVGIMVFGAAWFLAGAIGMPDREVQLYGMGFAISIGACALLFLLGHRTYEERREAANRAQRKLAREAKASKKAKASN